MTRLALINWANMVRILNRLGFWEQRRHGSHAFFRHPDGRTTIVPCHKGEDLGRGLIRKILRDIGITLEEYDELRKAL